jgi:hypothetical protein
MKKTENQKIEVNFETDTVIIEYKLEYKYQKDKYLGKSKNEYEYLKNEDLKNQKYPLIFALIQLQVYVCKIQKSLLI